MKCAFFRAKYGNIVDWMIDQSTGGYGFSNVETIFSNNQCFSCSLKVGGCFFKIFNQENYSLKAWDIIDVPISRQQD